MRCSKCGKNVKPEATFCTHCGNRLDVFEQNTENDNRTETVKRYKKHIIIGAIVVCFLVYFFACRCKSGLCLLPSGFSGEYCGIHTCKISGCTNKKATGKSYCYTHSPSSSSGISYTPEAGEDVLEFSNVRVTHNSLYTVCTGTITNNGRKTYTFVEVKGLFKNSSGTVLNTDWTYAVGSEGLAPGESTTFRLSVDKNVSITKCTMQILDYEKK